jgi:hypothetical protein
VYSIAWRQIRLWHICLVLLIFVLLAVAVMSFSLVEREWDPSGKAISSREQWPDKLIELFQVAEQKGIPVEHLQVYYGFHDDFFWKCDTTSGLLETMIDQWKLSPVNRDYDVIRLVYEYMPSALGVLGQNSDIQCYVSAELLPGGAWSGHLYCVIIDRSQKKIIVRYRYKF